MNISNKTILFIDNPQAIPVDISITINPKHVIKKVAEEYVFYINKNIN